MFDQHANQFAIGNMVRVNSQVDNPIWKAHWNGKIGKVVELNPATGRVWLDIPNVSTKKTCWQVIHLEIIAENEEELIACKLGEDYL